LAIPDFPLAYGALWPDMSPEAVARYNAQRIEVTAAHPITAFQIGLQMAHRVVAVLILVCVVALAWNVRSWSSRSGATPNKLKLEFQRAGLETVILLRRLAHFWLALILVQAGLGAWTIWSNKAADVATAHVLVGALSLVTGALWCIIAFRRLPGITETNLSVRSEAAGNSAHDEAHIAGSFHGDTAVVLNK
jgi:cytochrome c oxidase assembly protein subunit 15